jgi:hypothetical protein
VYGIWNRTEFSAFTFSIRNYLIYPLRVRILFDQGFKKKYQLTPLVQKSKQNYQKMTSVEHFERTLPDNAIHKLCVF